MAPLLIQFQELWIEFTPKWNETRPLFRLTHFKNISIHWKDSPTFPFVFLTKVQASELQLDSTAALYISTIRQSTFRRPNKPEDQLQLHPLVTDF